MDNEEYNTILSKLLGTTFSESVIQQLTPVARGENQLHNAQLYNIVNSLCSTDASTFKDICEVPDKPRMLDVDDICARLVEIVVQEYGEHYSDDIPKIFVHNLFEKFKEYLNEA